MLRRAGGGWQGDRRAARGGWEGDDSQLQVADGS